MARTTTKRLLLEARNPPLPVADEGECSANEATSFASVSVAKRLCRIARPHGTCACGASWRKCKQHYYFRCVPPHPSRYRSTPSPVWEKAFIVMRLAIYEGMLLHQRTALKASPWGEAPPQAVVRRVIRRCLWQMKADAAPMRQRVLQAPALQNDYAELRGRMALAPAGSVGGNVSSISCRIPPHPSRYRSTPAPVWEKAFMVVLSLCCLTNLTNHRSQPRLIPAPNHPPWHADRRSARGVRSTTKGESRKRTEESLLSSGRFRLSPATGLLSGSAAFQFYQLDFYVARSLLWYFLGLQESTVPLVLLVPLVPLPPVLAVVLGNLLHFFMLGGQLRRAVGFRRQRLIALP